jgi:branched-chain amino acid transport system substrate-binding protein
MNVIGRLFLFAVIGAGLIALSTNTHAAEFCPPVCSSGKVPLAISGPTSGSQAALGQQAVKSAEVAVQELNSVGGLLGIPVGLIADDDRCDAGLSTSVAKRQIEKDKIAAVLGPACPSAASAAAPIYAEAGVVQFLPTVPTLEPMRQSSERIFRIMVTDEQEAQALGAYLGREQTGKKITIVYIDAFYRREMIEKIKLALPVDMKASAQFKALLDSSAAYDRLADQLQRDQPDLIYLAINNAMVHGVVDKLRKRGVKGLLVGGQRLLSQSLWIPANNFVEDTLVVAPLDSPVNLEFAKVIDLLKRASVLPDLVALNTYAAVHTWAEAIRRAGSGDPAKVVEVLRSGTFQTAIGLVAFDQQGGRRDVPFSILSWRQGRLTEHAKGQQ